MSDYDKWAQFVLFIVIFFIITAPISLPIYGVWWLFKHKEWEQKARELNDRLSKRQVEIDAINKERELHPPKPVIYVSQMERKRYEDNK